MAIKRADGSIINPIKEAEPVMEEIVVNEEVHGRPITAYDAGVAIFLCERDD